MGTRTAATRVGLMGFGAIGRSHARALFELRDRAVLVGRSGGTPAAAAEAGWPDAAHLSPNELLRRDDVEVLVVCTPSGVHAKNALAALEVGKHVVVEKPLALTAGEADRIVALAASKALGVHVISQRRHEPEVRTVRSALEGGLLGAVRLATTHLHWWRDDTYYAEAAWRREAAEGGGSLMNQGVHNIDLLRWLVGPVESVTAQSATLAHAPGAEDTTVATLRFTGGALGLVSTSTATPPGTPATLTLHCERGMVEIRQGGPMRWEVEGVPAPALVGEVVGIGVGASNPSAIGIAGHVQQWRDILDALCEGRDSSVPGWDGAETVRLLDAFSMAAATGRTIRLEELR